ncbi:MAG: T9SS C-terminal target domain-containing protein, partial [Flavobacterium sp.]
DLNVPANAALGEHRMRVKSAWQEAVPNDACATTQYGETEDYTANIGDLGINDAAISNSDLIVVSKDNNQFEVTLRTDFDGGVYLGLYNVLGQEIDFSKTLPKIDGAYRMNLDMAKAASGVYLIRIGGQTTTSYKTARIIVK